MADSKPIAPNPPQIPLQSDDYEAILNAIDSLRAANVSAYVDLPQLVVCGDQSSGKSSVLEAISGVKFPSKDNLCTRFATELVLRRDNNTHVQVSIQPSEERQEYERAQMSKFDGPVECLDDFGAIVARAEVAMGLGNGTQTFARDVLKVEISGPKQPQLTLVDLPGLYHAPDNSQDTEGVALVESLVSSYMRNERSIILAIITAKSDLALQKVMAFTQKIDPQGIRTLGVITKPDTLDRGSGMEESFVKLARNHNVKFQLGWHVLKNLDYSQRHCSLEERHELEKQFFDRGVWSGFPKNQLGVSTLQVRLMVILKDQIARHMPNIMSHAEVEGATTEAALKKLGDSRIDSSSQRRYLLHTSERFGRLIESAVKGHYEDAFFGDVMSEAGFGKRLRACVQKALLLFAKTMNTRGHCKTIVEHVDKDFKTKPGLPTQIDREVFITEVQARVERGRGRELPGSFNPLIVGDLFYMQAAPWQDHVDSEVDNLLGHAHLTVAMVLAEVTDEQTANALQRTIIAPALQDIENGLRVKVRELLLPHQVGHPITYNHYFIDNVQKIRNQHMRRALKSKLQGYLGDDFPTTDDERAHFTFSVDGLLDAMTSMTESDMDRFACSEAIDFMQAYYTVALKTFIDDFSTLAIEKCLLDPLPTIFSPSTVLSLSDDTVRNIAAESEDSIAARATLTKKLESLQLCLKTLRDLNRKTPVLKHIVPPPATRAVIDTTPSDPPSSVCRSTGHVSTSSLDQLLGISNEPSAQTSEPPATLSGQESKSLEEDNGSSTKATAPVTYDSWPDSGFGKMAIPKKKKNKKKGNPVLFAEDE